jgi:hypothetical protein
MGKKQPEFIYVKLVYIELFVNIKNHTPLRGMYLRKDDKGLVYWLQSYQPTNPL